jgi:DNA uptake protein ComE-like DNA-binding protein
MKNRFREILFYSSRQRMALMLLCWLIIIMLAILIYIRHFMPLAELDPWQYQAFIDQWERGDSLSGLNRNSNTAARFTFDPNSASDSVLQLLGFPPGLRKTLVKYTSRGGRFDKPEDLLRIYGMDTVFFENIRPLIEIHWTDVPSDHASKVAPKPPITVTDTFDLNTVTLEQLERFGLAELEIKGIIGYRERFKPFLKAEDLYNVYNLDSHRVEKLMPYVRVRKHLGKVETLPFTPLIELNRADSVELLALRGIGPYFAGRMAKYRRQLGGYLSYEQLLEIPGMDSLKLVQLKPQLSLDTGLVLHININEANYDDMLKHPYIKKEVAKNIIRFREEYRRFRSTEELMNLELIDRVLFSKIAGYLKL